MFAISPIGGSNTKVDEYPPTFAPNPEYCPVLFLEGSSVYKTSMTLTLTLTHFIESYLTQTQTAPPREDFLWLGYPLIHIIHTGSPIKDHRIWIILQ